MRGFEQQIVLSCQEPGLWFHICAWHGVQRRTYRLSVAPWRMSPCEQMTRVAPLQETLVEGEASPAPRPMPPPPPIIIAEHNFLLQNVKDNLP
jgi:hypothetical protein